MDFKPQSPKDLENISGKATLYINNNVEIGQCTYISFD